MHVQNVGKVNLLRYRIFSLARVVVANGRCRTFVSSGNAIKQLIHALSCASSSYDAFAIGEFGEHSKS